MADTPARVTVIGEALIDLVPTTGADQFEAKPGGSPYNVAVGLARLGCPTSLMARLADNAFGRLLRDHAATEGLDLRSAPLATEPTTLAVVSLDALGQANYDFYVDGTADWQWTAEEASAIPSDTAVLHFGSIASWTPPGGQVVRELAGQLRATGRALVSFDPNVRPTLLGDPASARSVIEAAVVCAHLVKASREDLAWLYPGLELAEVGSRWAALGAHLVVITDGPEGAIAFRSGEPPVQRPGRPTQVIDTVGAGDSFSSGLLHALMRRGLHAPHSIEKLTASDLAEVLDEAILISSLTCERAGADPPVALATAGVTPYGREDLVFRGE